MSDRERIILCIEDEPEMIDLVRVILVPKGFRVVGAVGGVEGLQAVRRERPDVVLLDLMMPDLDGWDVYQEIKADPQVNSIPVIIITARAQAIDKVLGLRIAKVDDYLTKPFGPNDLLESINRVLN